MSAIALPLGVIAAAMLLVRLGWNRRRGVAVAGWLAIGAALLLLAWRDGAWGVAMGGVTGMAASLVIVFHAGLIAPARPRRALRQAPAIALPRHRTDLVRRIAVFVLVVPVAFAAAQVLAYGAQALARRAGAVEADATVLALFLQPLLWGGLMAWQMTCSGPGRMVAAPAAAAVLGGVLWGVS